MAGTTGPVRGDAHRARFRCRETRAERALFSASTMPRTMPLIVNLINNVSKQANGVTCALLTPPLTRQAAKMAASIYLHRPERWRRFVLPL